MIVSIVLLFQQCSNMYAGDLWIQCIFVPDIVCTDIYMCNR